MTARFDNHLLGGLMVLEGKGTALNEDGWKEILYRPIPPNKITVPVRAIPYFAWDNREPGAMTVWIHQ